MTAPIGPLWAAFVAAAGELTEPFKTAQADVQTRGGQRYSYRYLTLPQLSELVRATFARHGLAFRQQVTTDEHRVTTITTILHASGACWSCEPLTLTAASRAPQDLGSVMTYGRRYQLAALVGLSGSEDDDAAGQHPPADQPGADPPPNRDAPAAGRKPTAKQVKYLHTLLGQHGYSSRESVLAYLSAQLERVIESSGDLSAREVSDVIDTLKDTPTAQRTSAGDEPPAGDPWDTGAPA